MLEALLSFFTNVMIIVGGTITVTGVIFLLVLAAVEIHDYFKEKRHGVPHQYDGEDIWQGR